MHDIRTKTINAINWNILAHFGTVVVNFSMGVLLARLLSPREFGLLAMVMVFSGFVSIFTDLGFNPALIQRRDLDVQHLNSVFWLNVATGFLLTTIFIIVAPSIARFYGEPLLIGITSAIAFSFLIGSLGSVQNTFIQRQMEFRGLTQIQLLSISLSGGIGVILALFGFGVWSLVAKDLLAATLTVIGVWHLSTWRPKFSARVTALRDLFGYSSSFLGFQLTSYWMRNFDNLLIGRILDPNSLGVYARGYSLMLVPVTGISQIVSKAMFPALSVIQDDIGRVRQIYLKATRLIALVTFPLMVGLLVTARPFVLTLYGTKWADLIPIIQILTLVGLCQSVGTTTGWLYTSQGRTDLMFKVALGAGAIRIIGFIIGIRWGIIGVAIAYAVSQLIITVPSWSLAGGLIDLRFKTMARNLLEVSFYSGLMGLVLWGAGFFLPSNWPQWLILGVQLLFGGIIYLLALHFFNVVAYDELRTLVIQQIAPVRKSKIPVILK